MLASMLWDVVLGTLLATVLEAMDSSVVSYLDSSEAEDLIVMPLLLSATLPSAMPASSLALMDCHAPTETTMAKSFRFTLTMSKSRLTSWG